MSKVLLSLPEKLLKDLDIVCDSQGYDRSEYIRMCIRQRLYDTGDKMFDEAGIVKEIWKEAEDDLNGGEKSKNLGWCQLHFERGVKYPLTLITWEDENGNTVIDKKLACPKCVERYEKIGRGRVFYPKT
jgi:hypothetical protein